MTAATVEDQPMTTRDAMTELDSQISVLDWAKDYPSGLKLSQGSIKSILHSLRVLRDAPHEADCDSHIAMRVVGGTEQHKIYAYEPGTCNCFKSNKLGGRDD